MKKIATVAALAAISVSAKCQYTNLKSRNIAQDSLLESVFQKYLKANDSAADIRHIEMINNFSDSADKYTKSAAAYLDAQKLDSCIWMIHISNMYINNTQVLLHTKPSDKWLQFPKY